MKLLANWLVAGGLLLVLTMVNVDIVRKQAIVDSGRPILLRLRPVDPRSLIQGDFMALRYTEETFPESVPGATSHLEECTRFRDGDAGFTIFNDCDEAVIVEFLARRGSPEDFEIEPHQSVSAGFELSSRYFYTTCPAGFVSTVPITTLNPGLIRSGNYRCIEESQARRAYTGIMVLVLDADGVGVFRRFDDGSPLRDDEVRLRYRHMLATGEFRLGAESFFFEEGQADEFAAARFGVLHVDEDGESVLVGLADARRQLILPSE